MLVFMHTYIHHVLDWNMPQINVFGPKLQHSLTHAEEAIVYAQDRLSIYLQKSFFLP